MFSRLLEGLVSGACVFGRGIRLKITTMYVTGLEKKYLSLPDFFPIWLEYYQAFQILVNASYTKLVTQF